MSAGLALQKAIRARLISTPEILGLLPASSILDTNAHPTPSPSIILGEDQLVDDGDFIRRDVVHAYSTIHVWKKEPSLAGVKAIAGAIRTAIASGRASLDAGFELIDWYVQNTHFVRDPDGETSHGVVIIESKVREV